MAGVIFSVTIDSEAAEGELLALGRRMEDRRGFYANVAVLLADSARKNFDRQAGPDGAPWEPLKPSTIRKRRRAGQIPIRILRSNSRSGGVGLTGSSLVASINSEADADSARVGVPAAKAKYGAIHQFGGTINMPARKGRIYRHFDPTRQTFAPRFVKRDDPDAVATEVDIPAYSITIPAHPFLGVSAEDEVEIIHFAYVFDPAV